MRRNKRPTIVLVMAILNMGVAGLILLCGVCVGLDMAVTSAMGNASVGAAGTMGDLKTTLDKEAPSWAVVEVGYALMQVLLAIALLVAGIGLLKMQGWARWLSLCYSITAILLAFVFTTYVVAIMQPARLHANERQVNLSGQPSSVQTGYKMGKAFGTITNVFLHGGIPLAHAIALAIAMLLPSVGEAFARANRRRGDYEDRYDRRRRSREHDEEDDYDEDEPEGRQLDREDEDEGRFRRRPRDRYDDDV